MASLDEIGHLLAQRKDKATLHKRAMAKYATVCLMEQLITAAHSPTPPPTYATTEWPLLTNYHKTRDQCAHIINEHEHTQTSSYCHKRHCIVCNRIRTRQLITQYLPPINATDWQAKHFVTLTRPNVPAANLVGEIKAIGAEFTAILHRARQKRSSRVALHGIRKLEVTFNSSRQDYHPHLHIIVQSHQQAQQLVADWLNRNPTANPRAQDIRPANANSVLELFKYFTKLSAGHKAICPHALNTILSSMQGVRIIQPFGHLQSVPEPPPDPQQATPDPGQWLRSGHWHGHDWHAPRIIPITPQQVRELEAQAAHIRATSYTHPFHTAADVAAELGWSLVDPDRPALGRYSRHEPLSGFKPRR